MPDVDGGGLGSGGGWAIVGDRLEMGMECLVAGSCFALDRGYQGCFGFWDYGIVVLLLVMEIGDGVFNCVSCLIFDLGETVPALFWF